LNRLYKCFFQSRETKIFSTFQDRKHRMISLTYVSAEGYKIRQPHSGYRPHVMCYFRNTYPKHQLIIEIAAVHYLLLCFKVLCFYIKVKGCEALSVIKLPSRDGSKLCFKLLEILQQLKTTCPCAGG